MDRSRSKRLAKTNIWLYVQSMSDSCTYIKPLLDLFAGSLADVRFADLDAQTLTHAASDGEKVEEELAAAESRSRQRAG